jgi:hypothetical protein
MSKHEYICDECGEHCIAIWDDEEAIAEYERDFGPFDRKAVAEICDDCYWKLKAAQHGRD